MEEEFSNYHAQRSKGGVVTHSHRSGPAVKLGDAYTNIESLGQSPIPSNHPNNYNDGDEEDDNNDSVIELDDFDDHEDYESSSHAESSTAPSLPLHTLHRLLTSVTSTITILSQPSTPRKLCTQAVIDEISVWKTQIQTVHWELKAQEDQRIKDINRVIEWDEKREEEWKEKQDELQTQWTKYAVAMKKKWKERIREVEEKLEEIEDENEVLRKMLGDGFAEGNVGGCEKEVHKTRDADVEVMHHVSKN